MKCPICNEEMVNGEIKANIMINPQGLNGLKFVSEDKTVCKSYGKICEKPSGKGYYCERCNKIISVYEAN